MVIAKKSAGFTMMEILIVVGIILALAAFFLPRIFRGQEQFKRSQTELKINNIKTQVGLFETHMERYPKNFDEMMKAPKPQGRWNGPYVNESDIKDAWKNEIEFFAPPRYNKQFKHYEIISPGPDGEISDDDVVVGG